MSGYVYVRLADVNRSVAMEEQSGLTYVEDVDDDNWTTDPDLHRNPYDSQGADYLRVERSWAERYLEPAEE